MAFMRGWRALALAVVAALIGASTALAQAPVRVRGTIEKVDGLTLTVKARDGAMLTVKLPDNIVVAATVKRSLADIKPNDFVGIASMPQPGGSLRALEVLIFPEAARGSNEGHYAWDLMPQSMMTNATVAATVAKADGQTLTLKYKDGEQTIIVPPETPIVTVVPADKSELKPGATVFIFAARRADDGTLTTPRITVGRDIAPPM